MKKNGINSMKEQYINLSLIILSIITSIGLTANIDEIIKLAEGFNPDQPNIDYVYLINKTLNHDRILTSFVFFSICFLLHYSIKIIKKEKNKKNVLVSVVFSLIFSIIQVLAISFSKNDTSILLSFKNFSSLLSLIVMLAYCITIFSGISILLYHLDKNHDFIFNDNGSNKLIDEIFIKRFFILLLCWLPYYVFFYPGFGNGDTSTQINMFFHQRTVHVQKILNLSAVRSDSIFISNHHPYFTTLIFGFFAKIGINHFDSITSGIALYNIIQMILYCVEFSFVISYFSSKGVNKKILKYCFIFLLLNPSFPLHAICMTKDSLFALTYIPLSIYLIEILHTKGEILSNKKILMLCFVISLLFSLTKSQGMYFLFAILLFHIIAYRKKYKQLVIVFGIPALFVMSIWQNVLLPKWNVSPGGKQEIIGIMFQQTARYATEYYDEITKEEKEIISKVIDFDNIVDNYDPDLADPVKYTFNQDSTKSQMMDYYKVWLKMFFKHPQVYIDALLNNTLGSLYLSKNSSMYYLEFMNRSDDKIYTVNSKLVDDELNVAKNYVRLLQSLPAINLIISVSFYTIVTLFVSIYKLFNKRYKELIAMSIQILSILLLFISPANGNFRYNMPMLMLFLQTLYIFVTRPTEDKNIIE